MKYNLSKIMTRAWEIFRKAEITFSEALHRAWQSAKLEPVNAQRIQETKEAAGITEETNVSPVDSGRVCRWQTYTTDRGESRDRFAHERHWRSLTLGRLEGPRL